MKLTEHFTFEELTKTTSFPSLEEKNREDAKQYMQNITLLANLLEDIRDIMLEPIFVTSGFRNEELNKAVGGVSNSKHKKGLCADIIIREIDTTTLFNALLDNAEALKNIRKCIIESVKGKGWIHLEVKTDNEEPTEFYSTTDGKHFKKEY